MILFIYCAGGFGKEVMDTAIRINHKKQRWQDIFFIDDVIQEEDHYGVKKYTFEQVLSVFLADSFEVAIASGEPSIRNILYDKLKANNIRLATIIDETAVVSHSAQIDEGVIILHNSFVSSLAKIGANSVLYMNAIVGHESIISTNCFISTDVNVSGKCFIGENTYLGVGAKVRERISIGKNTIIGMGAIVCDEIPDQVIAYGVPARIIRTNIGKRVFK